MINKISTIMGENRMSISEVSRETQLNRSTVSKIYNGKSIDFSFKTLLVLCDYFKIPLHELIDYFPNKKGGD